MLIITICFSDDYENEPLQPGEIDIQEYRINLYDELGSGSYGRVCTAYHRITGLVVAAKQIKMYDFEADEDEEEAKNEVKNMKAIRHQNIIELFDFAIDPKHFWIFMEHGDQGDLETYLTKLPSLALQARGLIMQQVSSALSFIHQKKPPIIHRDLKPKNVVLKQERHGVIAKLTDFGLATFVDMSGLSSRSAMYRNMLETANLKGTKIYAAPEFFNEKEDGFQYTAAVDVFSLGLMCAAVLNYGPENKTFFPVSGKIC